MAASLKQDYAKILKADADLVMLSPDSSEQHRQYALTLFGDELPEAVLTPGGLVRELHDRRGRPVGPLDRPLHLGARRIAAGAVRARHPGGPLEEDAKAAAGPVALHLHAVDVVVRLLGAYGHVVAHAGGARVAGGERGQVALEAEPREREAVVLGGGRG